MKRISAIAIALLIIVTFTGCSKKQNTPEVKECERLNKGTLTLTNKTGKNCTVYIDGNSHHAISFLGIDERSSIELSAGELHTLKVTPSVIDYPTYKWERDVRLGACLESTFTVQF